MLFKYLEENKESSAFVFEAASNVIGELIITKRLSFDQLVVHGNLDKHEKFGLISLFSGTLSLADFLVRTILLPIAPPLPSNKLLLLPTLIRSRNLELSSLTKICSNV
mmetsp:Transcript_9985/g.22370  ORF Transcript_9985/g.22370 Transcript_9985/m.22370 type:complete len:108 (+) Transcript_9985:340-663(+)